MPFSYSIIRNFAAKLVQTESNGTRSNCRGAAEFRNFAANINKKNEVHKLVDHNFVYHLKFCANLLYYLNVKKAPKNQKEAIGKEAWGNKE